MWGFRSLEAITFRGLARIRVVAISEFGNLAFFNKPLRCNSIIWLKHRRWEFGSQPQFI